MNVAGRIPKVRAILTDRDLDALSITSLVNIRWLTGFTGSNAAVWVDSDHTVVYTDGRYRTQAPAELEANLV